MAAAAQQTRTMAKLAIVAALGGIIAVFLWYPVWEFLMEFVTILFGGAWFSVLSS